ncbi:hypothetical protein AHAS_Ahas04G0255000 [Arachis hypogaea]
MYAKVEKELRLCSRDSPYFGSTNVATCNELNTACLHFIDGFVSSPQKNYFSSNNHHHHYRLLVVLN